MKLSFWTLGMPAWSNPEFADRAAQLGYGGIDLRLTNGGNVTMESSEAEIDDVMRTYAAKGVGIASLLAYQKRGDGKSPVDWGEVEADLVAHAKLAQRMNNTPVRITVGYTDPSTSWDTYLANLASATKTAVREVPTVTFMYQNHAGSATAEQLGALTEKLADPQIRFGFSPDHCFAEGEDPLALARHYGPLIQQLHIADRKKQEDGTYAACWIGDGVVPHAAILETLAKHGFDGWVSLKWERGARSEMPQGDVVLPHFVQYIKGLDVPASR